VNRFWLLPLMAAAPVLAVIVFVVVGQRRHPNLIAAPPDPLRHIVPSVFPATDPLAPLPVGVTEDGATYRMATLYNHILIAGVTGSGKGSALWSLLLGLAPGVRAGTVVVWGIDPKGGMELSVGEELFSHLVTTPAQAADLLEAAVRSMGRRAERCRQARTRLLVPTEDEPHVVIVIDEMGALTAWVEDYSIRRRITYAMSVLLSQGRAVGVTVIGATQDARKEVLSMRDLFPTRVALRTAEAGQADIILGRGARERGAYTDHISPRTPGVGYVLTEGRSQPLRVRFAYQPDSKIRSVTAAARAA
jgi:DNA segregation ATPase FtsK/SpoIIIE, S-DNA-T family